MPDRTCSALFEVSEYFYDLYRAKGLETVLDGLREYCQSIARQFDDRPTCARERLLALGAGLAAIHLARRPERLIPWQIAMSQAVCCSEDPTLMSRSLFGEIEALLRGASIPDTASATEKVRRFLTTCPLEKMKTLTVESMAACIGCNPRHLSARFRAEQECTLQDCLITEKLQRAFHLLRRSRGQVRVKDVARLLGYQKSEHFTKIFKERYGFPPSQLLRDAAADEWPDAGPRGVRALEPSCVICGGSNE